MNGMKLFLAGHSATLVERRERDLPAHAKPSLTLRVTFAAPPETPIFGMFGGVTAKGGTLRSSNSSTGNPPYSVERADALNSQQDDQQDSGDASRVLAGGAL